MKSFLFLYHGRWKMEDGSECGNVRGALKVKELAK